jgi:hypothetical protein
MQLDVGAALYWAGIRNEVPVLVAPTEQSTTSDERDDGSQPIHFSSVAKFSVLSTYTGADCYDFDGLLSHLHAACLPLQRDLLV